MKRKRCINKDRTPVAVSCPSWLRRRILRNLQRSSLDRFNKTRADKARELLVAINTKPNIVVSQTQSKPDFIKASVDTNKAMSCPTQSTVSKAWVSVGSTFKKCMSHIIAFGKRKKHFQPAHT